MTKQEKENLICLNPSVLPVGSYTLSTAFKWNGKNTIMIDQVSTISNDKTNQNKYG